MKFQTILSAALSTAFLAACGGGGGGGTAYAPAPIVTASLNSTNQGVVAQEVTSTAFSAVSNSTTAVTTIIGAQTVDESALFSFAFSQLGKAPAYLTYAKENAALVGAVNSRVVNCTYAGTLTVSAVDADSSGTLTAGDSLTITGNNCNDSSLGSINGSATMTFSNLSGTLGSSSYSAGLTMTFNNLSMVNGQYNVSMNGATSLSETVTGTNAWTSTFAAPSLTSTATYAGVSRSRTLSSYSATETRSPDATYGYLTSFSFAGAVTSSALSSQTVTFNTTTSFVTRGGDAYPFSGVLLITGAAGTQLKLTALSSSQVKQELDANGDGTFESSTTANWNTLL